MPEVSCKCGKRYRVPDHWLGKRIKCQKCGNTFEAAPDLPAEVGGSAGVKGFHARSPSLTAIAERELAADREAAAPEPRTARDYAYVLLLLAMLPLALLAFGWGDHPGQRLEESLERASPQTRMQVAEIKDKLEESGPLPDWVFHLLPAAFYDTLPDSRIEGALLARGSYAHWAIALPAAAVYLGLIVVLFPRGGTRPVRLLLVGLFTSTVGILILVCLQLLAEATRGIVIVGGGIIGVVFWAFKLLAGGYDIALDPNTGFILSAIGFTVSVGVLEEGVKALPVLYRAAKPQSIGWRGLCTLGLASGAAFGIAEGILYASSFYNGIRGTEMYLVRFVSCVALHAVWTGSAGIFAYQQRKQIRQAGRGLGFLNMLVNVTVLSVLLHGMYDTLLKKEHDVMALLVAAVSVGVLAAQIEFMRRQEQGRLGSVRSGSAVRV